MGQTAAVLGASGYAGGEVVRLIDDHPAIDLIHLGAHRRAGESLAAVHPHLPDGDRILGSGDVDDLPDIDVAFLALPHGASAGPGLALAARGVTVVDLGSDFRMDTPERYEAAYGAPHPAPDQLGEWVYGLPELFGGSLVGAHRIAVPGCYPTSALLALAPLVRAGLIDHTAIVVDAMSGVTGAGRALKGDLLFGAVDEGVRAYGVTTHRHRPEMECGLDAMGSGETTVSFTPHLVPMQRGILSTCSAPVSDGVVLSDVVGALRTAYEESPFVEVIDGPPQTRWVVGSNRCLLAPFVDDHSGRVIVLSAIDNLLKGAAGQAVQCANLALGLPEETGLSMAGWMP